MNERDMSLLKAVGEAVKEQLAVVQQKYESALSAQSQEIENLTEKVKMLSAASPDEAAIARAVLAQIAVPVAPELPDIQQLVKDAVSTIQLPEAPKAPELPDIEGMINKAVDRIQIPQPALPDVEQLVKDAVSAIQLPEAPKAPELPDIEGMIEKAVNGIQIPPPKLPDIQQMVKEAVSALPSPKDGDPGEDGKDALQLEIMPCIDEEKSYPRGSYAIHHGGLWRSYQKTTGLNGWECLVDGISSVDISQANEREFTITAQLASGTKTEKSFSIPVMIYRDIFKDGEKYLPGDSVTWAGSVWYCHAETTDKPGEPSSKGWKLAVKRGRDARAKIMIGLVTLDEVKSYLRIDTDAADNDLQEAIYQASAVILDYVKGSRSLIIDDSGEVIEGEALQRVKRSTLILVGIFDRVKNGEEEQRYSQGNLPFSVTAFIYTLHTPTVV